MGLFNRGSRPDRERDKQSAEPTAAVNGNGAAPEHAAPAPEPAADAPEPAAEASPEREPVSEQASDAGAEAAPEPSGEQPAEPRDEQPKAGSTAPPAEPEAPRAPAPPPVNPTAADSDDEHRITASQAIGPSRTQSPADAEPGARKRRVEVISFANQKGGVAKTTTTLNLAVAFAESGHDVLAVDLDPQGNLTMSQGIDPDKVEKSMYDVLVHHIPIREVIQSREIDVAVASIDLAGAEIAMSTQIGRERALEKAIAAIADDYDFVCIDTPPSLGLLTVNALTASDKVIVPVQCEYLSMRGLVQLQNTLEMIRENLNPDVRIEGILPTMLDSRTVHAKEAVEILEENFGELVFKSRIRKAIKFAEAPVRGSSVLKYDPSGNAANCYRELAKEVLTNGAS